MKTEIEKGVTVFVIDDDDDARKGLSRLVRSAGWHVEDFGSAQAFLERLPYSGVGCVMLDVQMPGMTGPQLQDRMLESGVSLPIVYLTGHADVPMSVHAMKHGALDVLQKPADDAAIVQAIGAALARHELVAAADRERSDVYERIARLSPREREVMECVISGRLNKQIAGDLGITEKTVKAHRARVMEKLQTRSVAGLVRLCALAGIEPRDFGVARAEPRYRKEAFGSCG
ncbi:MAG TPA: response regulator [Burkholderiales bacterium]|nr:response regulator [Burkholderiales bacterium]